VFARWFNGQRRDYRGLDRDYVESLRQWDLHRLIESAGLSCELPSSTNKNYVLAREQQLARLRETGVVAVEVKKNPNMMIMLSMRRPPREDTWYTRCSAAKKS
jgi:hypothetical protein